MMVKKISEIFNYLSKSTKRDVIHFSFALLFLAIVVYRYKKKQIYEMERGKFGRNERFFKLKDFIELKIFIVRMMKYVQW